MSSDPAMDCPRCQTRNPVGALTCSKCRSPLGGDAPTLVGELTPPPESSGVTLDGGPATPSASAEGETLDGTAASSMAIPSAWSVPAPVRVGPGGSLVSPASLKPGTLLGNRYEIIDMLGEGGMGAVYKTRDRELDRLVAVKVIRPEFAGRPELLQRFKQELILARKVTHRNVIRIFDLGEADGIKFITMEFIEGRDLKSLLTQRGKLPADEAVEIMLQVCLALDAAHTEGVVHRDLKPQNIMIDGQGRALVMDFGIARSLEFGGMTQTGALIGTPEYMSPEQVRGEHVDARSDIFTLGIILQELLTGVLPYQAETAMASMFKRTMERAVSVHQLNPEVPQFLSDIVAKCLEIQPQGRYQTVREVYDALEAWKSGAEAPLGLRTLGIIRRRSRKHLGWIAASLALVVVGIAAFIVRNRFVLRPATAHSPVTVMISDFSNHTGDPMFDGTLEPMLKLALEGAGFISAYDRTQLRSLGLPAASGRLDEQAATKIAVGQGLGVVISGSLERQGAGYGLSLRANQAVTGKTITTSEGSAANKEEILFTVTKIASKVRTALGDETSESAQRFAMETLSATSLEAIHEYALAMDALANGKNADALRSFSKAADLDPNFGLADAGEAIASRNLGEHQDAEKYIKEAITHIDRMTERERYRLRGQYYIRIQNWQKCVEEYSELVKQYPADNSGHSNLAECYSYMLNMPKALEVAREGLQLAPKDVMSRMNFTLYSCYASDFQSCESGAREVFQLNPQYEEAFLALAYAQVGENQLAQAAQTYQNLEKVSAWGASLADSGRGELAVYQGRIREAIRILEKGAAADLAAKKPDLAADKFLLLASANLLHGDKQAAIAAADKALLNSPTIKVRFLAARTFVEAGDFTKARKLADGLSSEIQTAPQAYGKILFGEIALQQHKSKDAIPLFSQARDMLDTWIGRFDLGRAYMEAGAFAEADSEFDRCIKRRGESLEFFMDDMPTYGRLPVVYYYQGRVREGLKSAGFADSYQTYLGIRGQSTEDPLVVDARRRLHQ